MARAGPTLCVAAGGTCLHESQLQGHAGLSDADLRYLCAQLEAQGATWPDLQVSELAPLEQAESHALRSNALASGARHAMTA